ncbi:Multiple epidermal growth factor-like domains protein 8 [Borealophlyctis nickersoniae]|nr:Multiple epidermal growth factor-like domains protein 8 [Borealophlyctis nickersoniae]
MFGGATRTSAAAPLNTDAELWLLNTTTGAWKQLSPGGNAVGDFPVNTGFSNAFQYNDTLYVFGPDAGFLKFNLLSSVWERLRSPSAPTLRFATASYARDQNMYIVGGVTPNGFSNQTLRFSAANGTWSKLADLPTNINNAGFAPSTINSEALVFSGFGDLGTGSTGFLHSVFRYRFRNNTWEEIAPSLGPVPDGRERACFANVANRIFLYGGQFVPNGSPSTLSFPADLWEYVPETNSWYNRNQITPFGRTAVSCTSIGSILYVSGLPASDREVPAVMAVNVLNLRVFDPTNVTAPPTPTPVPSTGPPASSSEEVTGTQAGPIAGGVVGTLVVVALLLLASVLFYKKRKTFHRRSDANPDTHVSIHIPASPVPSSSLSFDSPPGNPPTSFPPDTVVVHQSLPRHLRTDIPPPYTTAHTICTCHIPFTPTNSDEIDVNVGDIVLVKDRFPDGWVRGVNQGTGQEGFCPGRCLEEGAAVSAAGTSDVSNSGGRGGRSTQEDRKQDTDT